MTRRPLTPRQTEALQHDPGSDVAPAPPDTSEGRRAAALLALASGPRVADDGNIHPATLRALERRGEAVCRPTVAGGYARWTLTEEGDRAAAGARRALDRVTQLRREACGAVEVPAWAVRVLVEVARVYGVADRTHEAVTMALDALVEAGKGEVHRLTVETCDGVEEVAVGLRSGLCSVLGPLRVDGKREVRLQFRVTAGRNRGLMFEAARWAVQEDARRRADARAARAGEAGRG